MSVNLQAVFIDTFYNPINPSEVSKFNEHTNKLMMFADKVQPFECKDIKIALNELMEAQQMLKNMTQELENLENEMKNQDSNCLFGVCFRFNPITFGGLTTTLIIIGGLLAAICICTCQNPCNWCCTCWNNCGKCSKCCFPGKIECFLKVGISC